MNLTVGAAGRLRYHSRLLRQPDLLLLARLETQKLSSLAQIRSVGLSACMIAIVRAMERHTTALANEEWWLARQAIEMLEAGT